MGVPLRNKGEQTMGERCGVGEVREAQALALQDAEELFDLVHPRAVSRQKMRHKARVRGHPGLNLFSFVNTAVIQDYVNGPHLSCDLTVQLLQKGDEFYLALARSDSSIDVAAACVEGGKQVHSSLAPIFMFETNGLACLSGKRGSCARTRLQIRLFVHAHYHFPSIQQARVKGVDLLHCCGEDRIAGHGWRESQR